jgi:C4-dicarboxylate-binding protein DctP
MIRILVAIAIGATLSGQAAVADSFTLRIGSGHPVGATVYVTEMSTFFVPEVVKRVKERTKHEVTFTESYGGSVAKVNETLNAVELGLLDIGGYCMCFEQSRLLAHNFPYWVPFGPKSSVVAIKATRQVYDEFPELSAVFEKKHSQKLIALSGYDNYNLGTTFAWETLTDLKGKKVGAAGPNLPWLQGSGAVGVSSNLPDGYNGLKSGLYSGWIMFPSAYNSFKFYEPSPNYKLVDFGSVMVNAMTINVRTWKKLPKDVQDIVLEVAREYETRQAQSLDRGNKDALAELAKVAKVTTVSPQARVEWAQGLKDWPNQMAQDAKRTGLPTPAILSGYLKHLKEAGVETPVPYVIQK